MLFICVCCLYIYAFKLQSDHYFTLLQIYIKSICKRYFFSCLSLSTDETATENILKAMQIYSSICGTLNMTTPRDAFITALCKASLPPHYTLTVLNTNLLKTDSKGKFYYFFLYLISFKINE